MQEAGISVRFISTLGLHSWDCFGFVNRTTPALSSSFLPTFGALSPLRPLLPSLPRPPPSSRRFFCSSLHLFLQRHRPPQAREFLFFPSDQLRPPDANVYAFVLSRLFGGCVLALLLIISARNFLSSRRALLLRLPAQLVQGLSLKASRLVGTNSTGRDILLHQAAALVDSAISAGNATDNQQAERDSLVLVEDILNQGNSVVSAALFVYGRGTANDHRTSYSMIYDSLEPAYDCLKPADITLFSKTYRMDAITSNNPVRNILSDGNPTASCPGNSEIIKVKNGEDDKGQKLFEAWLSELEEEAIHKGVSRDVIKKAFSGVKVSEDILEIDSNQPELKLSADAYITRVVTDLRISNGVRAFRENSLLLNEIADKYGVPAPILVAIWGIESNYGSFMGNWDIIQALVTLAYGSEGRRARFFREELITALKIMEQGHGPGGDSKLKGSWAGAMGQCQFMPSSFQEYAVDYDEDGCKDIWESRADALASMANYLQLHGWKKGCPVAKQVTIPETLDMSVLGLAVKKTLAEWSNNYEVHILIKEESLQNETASLIAPDGPKGRFYLVFDNFNTIMTYNPSILFALSIYELSSMIANKADFKLNESQLLA